MADLNSQIKDYVAGDNIELLRYITNIPLGDSIATAYFTIKTKVTDTTPLVQKIIGSTNNVGVGQITGQTVRIDLTPTDTSKLQDEVVRYFDLELHLTPSNNVYTPERGKIRLKAAITTGT